MKTVKITAKQKRQAAIAKRIADKVFHAFDIALAQEKPIRDQQKFKISINFLGSIITTRGILNGPVA